MEMLHLHGIDINSIIGMRESAEQKMRACFTKLNKIIVKNNLSLGRVFRDFDKKKKGYLTYEDFKTMTLKLSKEITE
jgi:Ca2+-binding EF-hand superfamily protein